MARNVHTLNSSHQWFADGKRRDPMSHSEYKIGDRVVVCSGCKQACKESTWDDMGGKCSICECATTQREFLTPPSSSPLVIGRRPRPTTRETTRSVPSRPRVAASPRTAEPRRSLELVGSRYQIQEDGTSSTPRPQAEQRPFRRETERDRRIREQEKNREVMYYVALCSAGGVSLLVYIIFWFRNFSGADGNAITFIISVVALFFINVYSVEHWKDEESIEENWDGWAVGFFKSLGIILVTFVVVFFVSSFIFPFIFG